jgi:tetratricopeptide (TPR) repeat protein
MASGSGNSARGALALLAALALAGCNSLGMASAPPDAHVAEVEPDQTGASAVNIASLSDVIQRNPNDSAAYNTRGAAYARIGRYQNAIDDFTHAVQIDPNFVAAYVNRALAYRQIRKDSLALADFNQALAVNPNHAPAYLGRANLLRSGLPCARPDLPAPGR